MSYTVSFIAVGVIPSPDNCAFMFNPLKVSYFKPVSHSNKPCHYVLNSICVYYIRFFRIVNIENKKAEYFLGIQLL